MLRKVLFISHESSRTGAPLVLLYFLQWLKEHHSKIWVTILSLEKGNLSAEFKGIADEYFEFPIKIRKKTYYNKVKTRLGLLNNILNEKELFIKNLADNNFDIVYANTIVTIPLALKIKTINSKSKVIAHIHELDCVIKKLLPNLNEISKNIDVFIAVSDLVKLNLVTNYFIPESKIERIYEFTKFRTAQREKNIKSFIVGGCGTVEWRKGSDLFIQLASIISSKYPEYEIKFRWVGNFPDFERIRIESELSKANLKNNIFTGETENPEIIFESFELLAMTSREDPFPLVCIEFGMLEKPIICFKGATGTEEILKYGGGEIIPYLDVEEMANQIIIYYENREKLKNDGKKAKELFSEYTPSNQAPKIFNILNGFN